MAKRDTGSNIAFFLAGFAMGAIGALLLVPRSGEEARQAGSWSDKGREYLNQQKEQIRSAYEAGRQAYREPSAGGLDSAELGGDETTKDRS